MADAAGFHLENVETRNNIEWWAFLMHKVICYVKFDIDA